MIVLLATLLLAPSFAKASEDKQDKFPVEDHAWLRFKAGTWVTNKVVVEANGQVVETLQKQRLKLSVGDDYTIEVTETLNGNLLSTRENQSSNGVVTGKETVTVDGKEHACTITTAKGRRAEGETEFRYWMPKGNKYPLKVAFKQPGFEGELVALAVDEKVKVGEREYSCARLYGKVKQGSSEGTMTVWVTQELPGAQGRMELTLNTPNGEVKIKSTPTEVHEEK